MIRHSSQNPVDRKARVGSIPSSGMFNLFYYQQFGKPFLVLFSWLVLGSEAYS